MADASPRAAARRDPAENSRAGGEPIRSGEQSPRGAAPNADASDQENGGHDDAAAARPARRPVAFQAAHALKFGLEVVAREPPGRVTAVLCLFCKHFGREPKAGAKRRATTNFKYFKGVFRTDQYLQHHRLQHPVKWAEYDAASVREKQTFFPRYLMATAATSGEAVGDDTPGERPAKAAKKLRRGDSGQDEDMRRDGDHHHHHEPDSTRDSATKFEIPLQVVALLVGEARWQPLSLPSCEPARVGTDDPLRHDGLLVGLASHPAEVQDVYRGALPDRLSFDMAVDLCATGLSASQVARSLQAMATYVPNGAALASVWSDLVENYSQISTLGSLTLLPTLMADSWAFSIGFHRHGDSEHIVAVRARFLHSGIHEFHLCCLRIDEVKDKLPQVLNVVCPEWQRTLTGISIAGDVFVSTKLGHAVQSLRNRAITSKTTWVTWDGNSLIRRAVVQLFHQLQGGLFAATFRNLRTYVKSQSRLMQEIGHETQPHGTDARASDGSVAEIVTTARWFTDKRVRIRKYFEEESEPTSSRPSEAWWLCLAIFDWVATPAEQVMRGIRVRLGGLVPAEQLALVKEFESEVSAAFRVRAADAASVGGANAVKYVSTQGSYAATKTGVLEFIVELGSFVNSLLASLGHDDLDVALGSIGVSVATFVDTLKTGLLHGHVHSKLCGVAGVASESGAFNSLLAPPPPVLPQEIIKLNGKALSALLAQYRTQLLTRFTEEDLDAVEQEHQALKRAAREKDFRAWASETPTDRLDQFDVAWAKTTGRFRTLHAFAGGLATVLPPQSASPRGCLAVGSPTATRTLATLDAELEAPLHAAQFHALQRLWRSVV